MHFFGDGDPAIYSDTLRELGLHARHVIFHKHSPNMAVSIRQFNIDIAWSVCMADSISYAAIELILLGVPVWFIDLSVSKRGISDVGFVGSRSVEQTARFHGDAARDPQLVEAMRMTQHSLVDTRFSAKRLSDVLMRIYCIG
jgi:hypothetical protein